MDNIYRDRLKCIDSIAVSKNILNYIKRYKLYEINEIVDIDYRGYIVYMNFNVSPYGIFFECIFAPKIYLYKLIEYEVIISIKY